MPPELQNIVAPAFVQVISVAQSVGAGIKNFVLNINGGPSGGMYYDYQRSVPFDLAHCCFVEKAFTFDGDIVNADTTVYPPVAVIHL